MQKLHFVIDKTIKDYSLKKTIFKKYKNFPKIDKTLPDKEIKRYLLYLFDLAKFPNAENL